MIPWWGLILAFFAGGIFGVFILALIVVSVDENERRK